MALYESQLTTSVSPSFVALAVRSKAEMAAKSCVNSIFDQSYGAWAVREMRHAVSKTGKLILIARMILCSKSRARNFHEAAGDDLQDLRIPVRHSK